MSDANVTGDSKELEDLFDSIAFGSGAQAAAELVGKAAGKPSLLDQLHEGNAEADDSEELQALFDSVVDGRRTGGARGDHPSAADGGEEWQGQGKVFQRVGQMARQLHDTLRALGYHELIESTVAAIPDTRDRLSYVANLTEQAACRVLNATDIANPLLEEVDARATALASDWDAVFANRIGVDQFKRLAEDTRSFLKTGLPEKTGATKAQLLEIMMAQDFQDLTGQVIKKIIVVAQELESQLMDVLIETMPGERRTESVMSLLNGPVINAEGRSDAVATQQQVDDLLDSLGF
jgi:chemotaxis protein CheZ